MRERIAIIGAKLNKLQNLFLQFGEHNTLNLFGLVVALIWAVFVAMPTVPAADTWWHLGAGHWLWTSGNFFTHADPFSFGSGVGEWLNHEWLAEVIFFLVFAGYGLTALFCLRTLLVVVSFLLIPCWFAHTRRLNLWLYVPLAFLCYCCANGWAFFDVRGYLFTYLFLSVLLLILQLYESGANQRAIWWIPLIIVFWGNMHGGYMVGLGIVFAYALGMSLAKVTRRKAVFLTFIGLLSLFAVGTLNPSGFKMLTFPFSLMGKSAFTLGLNEWAKRDFGQAYSLWILILAQVCCWPRLSWARRLLALGAVSAGCLAWRHAPLVALITIWQLQILIPQKSLPSSDLIPAKTICRLFMIALVMLGVAGLFAVGRQCWRGVTYWSMENTAFPRGAVDFLQLNQNLPRNIYNPYEWGGYLEFRLSNRYHYFQDGRANTLYSEQRYAQGLYVQYGEPWRKILTDGGLQTLLQDSPQRLDVLDLYGIDMVLCNRRMGDLDKKLADNEHWQVVYRDAISGIYLRTSKLSNFTANGLYYPISVDDMSRQVQNLISLQKKEEALQLCRRALELDRNNIEVRTWLAFILFDSGNLTPGLWETIKLLILDPCNENARNMLCTYWHNLAKPE